MMMMICHHIDVEAKEIKVAINCRFWTTSVSGLRKLGTINVNKLVMVDFLIKI